MALATDVLEFMTRNVEILGMKGLGVLAKRITNNTRSFVVKDRDTDVIKWDIVEGGPANVFIREGETAWGTNVNKAPELMTLRLARMWVPFEFTGLEKERGHLIGNDAYLSKMVEVGMTNSQFQIRRMFFSDHTEKLAAVPVAAGGAVSDVIVDSVKWLKVGMTIDFYTAAGVVQVNGASLTLTYVNPDTKQIKWAAGDGTPTLTDLDEVFIAGNRNLGVYGISAWDNDGAAMPGTKGTPVIGGQTRAAERPTLNGLILRNGGVPRPLSFQLMDELVAQIYARDDSANISAIYGGTGTVYSYKKLLQDKQGIRTPTGLMEYKYGDNKYPVYANDLLTPNEIPVISDPYLEEGILYFLSEKDIGFHGDKKFSWIPGMIDGKFVHLGNISNKDVFKATLKMEFQFTANSSRHGALADLQPEFTVT